MGINVIAKPSTLVLAFILCIALTTWGSRLLGLRDRLTTIVGVAGMVGLCATYVIGYVTVDAVLGSSLPAVATTAATPWVLLGIGLAFCVLFALHTMLLTTRPPTWLNVLRIHATNGFYVDAVYRRVFASLAKS